MKPKQLLILVGMALVLGTGHGWAASAVACHCFRDRSFDPARPGSIDPYLLANAQNSLMAASFDLSKKDIVKEKMGGVDNDQLWIRNAFSEATGMPPDQVLAARNGVGSWGELFARLDGEGKIPKERSMVLRQNRNDQALAEAVVNDVLHRRLGVGEMALADLRTLVADNREVILAAVMGRIGGVPPVDLLYGVREGRFTWGEIAQRFGVAPSEMEERVRRLVNSSPSG